MMVHTGCSLVDVFRYASANPARLLGWKNQGVIHPGNIADLIVVDSWMGVKQVIKQGRLIQEFS